MRFGVFLIVLCFLAAKLRGIDCARIESTVTKTRFIDLNRDCQEAILDQMDLTALINMGRTNRYYKIFTQDVFKREHSNKLFQMDIMREGTQLPNPVKSIHNKVVISDLRVIENVLKVFGHEIKKVVVENVYDMVSGGEMHASQANGVGTVARLLNDHSTESLLELSFYNFTTNPLVGVSKPFANVEILRFVGFSYKIESYKEQQLNELFPQLRRLTLLVSSIQLNRYDMEFAHLEHVDIQFSVPNLPVWASFKKGFDQKRANEFFTVNPQIRSFNGRLVSLSNLKQLTYTNPNLTNLSVALTPQNSDYQNEIRFRNVKKFTFIGSEFPENLLFDQLEEVDFSIIQPVTRREITYLGQFQGIKKFTAGMKPMLKTPIEKDILRIIPERLRNLEEVTLVAGNDIRRYDVINFIKSCKNLKQLQIVHTNRDLSQSLAYKIDETFDVSGIWDETTQEGSITFELKYAN